MKTLGRRERSSQRGGGNGKGSLGSNYRYVSISVVNRPRGKERGGGEEGAGAIHCTSSIRGPAKKKRSVGLEKVKPRGKLS